MASQPTDALLVLLIVHSSHTTTFWYGIHDEEQHRPRDLSAIVKNSNFRYIEITKFGLVLQEEIAECLSIGCT